ncbi:MULTISPECIES: isopenicillin N synthase family oxygenase [Microbacterium]|uniref:isopenicillin N synthase family dioxygenase n=1 Tax=Microbacterium TaxID=33882 RepID=UPI002786D0EE|nr:MULTISPECIES: 2-oxoglutarate and iron-dependent oxygenase domain-containing protein [Microbacterium]MDQ1077081.1 isopenicillin N synthase-like dioxygenase [Microbacterium sp. SORGH_AS_0969]MDQ1117323.1 isopenicillin N synthase-like dioxygenase [Microbacterium testaceum]
MPPFAVPLIDISAWVGDGSDDARAAVVAAMDHAARTVGFMQVVGHGIPDSVVSGLTGALDEFFALPLDAKKAYVRPAAENRGYSPPKSESLSYSLGVDPVTRMNDFFEAFNVGASWRDYPGTSTTVEDYAENTWPDAVPSFHGAVETYFDEARRVAHTLTRILAAALRVREDFFDTLTDHSIDVLRMNNYALPPGSIELGAELTGMGEHTDFGLVTVLWADQVAGLQVLGQDGSWNDVSPADGALLVNLGDVAARLTNDKWMSTLHRVKPPVIDGTIERRRSAAFFHDGNADAVIAPLPHFVTREAPALYEPVTVREHIAAKLAGSRAGRKNVSAVREAARVAASRG